MSVMRRVGIDSRKRALPSTSGPILGGGALSRISGGVLSRVTSA